MILTGIEKMFTLAVTAGGAVLLIWGIIYEELIIAFEYGLKEYIKKRMSKWKSTIKRILGTV